MELATLVERTLPKEYLLDRTVLEQQAFARYDELYPERSAKWEEIAHAIVRWTGDPDWVFLLQDVPNAERLIDILKAERVLYAFVEQIEPAARHAWELTQLKDFKAADRRGLGLSEYRTVKAEEEAWELQVADAERQTVAGWEAQYGKTLHDAIEVYRHWRKPTEAEQRIRRGDVQPDDVYAVAGFSLVQRSAGEVSLREETVRAADQYEQSIGRSIAGLPFSVQVQVSQLWAAHERSVKEEFREEVRRHFHQVCDRVRRCSLAHPDVEGFRARMLHHAEQLAAEYAVRLSDARQASEILRGLQVGQVPDYFDATAP